MRGGESEGREGGERAYCIQGSENASSLSSFFILVFRWVIERRVRVSALSSTITVARLHIVHQQQHTTPHSPALVNLVFRVGFHVDELNNVPPSVSLLTLAFIVLLITVLLHAHLAGLLDSTFQHLNLGGCV